MIFKPIYAEIRNLYIYKYIKRIIQTKVPCFVISAFLMFIPKLPMYKNGLKIAGIGAVVTVLVVVFGS